MDTQKERLSRKLCGELLPNMADYVRHDAARQPDGDALIEFDTGEKVSWKDFDRAVSAFSAKLEGRVGNVAVVGAEHEVFTEAIMAFVESA